MQRKVKIHKKMFLHLTKLMFAYNGPAVLRTAITSVGIKTSQSIIENPEWRESCIWTIRIQKITVWIGWFKKDMRSLITLMITPFKVVARDDCRCLLEIPEIVKDEATNNQDIEITTEFSPFFLSNPLTNSFAAKSQKGWWSQHIWR